jgi:hypothetical protein
VFDEDMTILYSSRDDDDIQLNPNVDEWFHIQYKDQNIQPIIPDKVHQLYTGDHRNFCNECCKPYQSNHVCSKVCAMCGDAVQHYKLFQTTKNGSKWKQCSSCNRKFYTMTCWGKHLENKTCTKIWKCRRKILYPKAKMGFTKDDHNCSDRWCTNCSQWIDPASHQCYVKKVRMIEKKKWRHTPLLVFRFRDLGAGREKCRNQCCCLHTRSEFRDD